MINKVYDFAVMTDVSIAMWREIERDAEAERLTAARAINAGQG